MEQEPKMAYEIRKATPDDIVKLRTLHADIWRETYPSEENGVPEEWVREYTEKWLTPEKLQESVEVVSAILSDPNQFYLSAWSGDEPMGFIHVLTKEDGTKRLEGLYVDKSMRGTGLSRELMAQADEFIGDNEVDLEVASYNSRAIRFYEKHGFEIDRDGGLFKGKIPCTIMVRKGRNG